MLGTCIIYTTMYTTEIPHHSSGNTYHCHKGSHLVSRVNVHIRNPVEPKLSVYLHYQAHSPMEFHNFVLCKCWLLVAILKSKCSVTMHAQDLFLGIFSGQIHQNNLISSQINLHIVFMLAHCKLSLFFFIFFALFRLNLLFLSDGGGRLPTMGTATGLKSDIQWAEKWRTVGWKVTYAGLKSDVWAKMQHWSVIIFIIYQCLPPVNTSPTSSFFQNVISFIKLFPINVMFLC